MPNQRGQCGAAAASGTCKKDCNGDWGVPAARAAVDQCGRCRGGRTGAAACARDCTEVHPCTLDKCGKNTVRAPPHAPGCTQNQRPGAEFSKNARRARS